MIGIIVELIVSYLLLRFICKNDLSALGLKSTGKRVMNLLAGLLLAAFACSAYHILATSLANNGWILNKDVSTQNVLAGVWWTFKSVMFEELIFRGALLYIAIEKFGVTKSCLFSAAWFGIYHWFSYNVLGDPVQMIFVFIMTGIFGLMLALAFAKTRSLYLPVGLHFGWNLFSIVVFSDGPLGKLMFITKNENQLQGVLSWCIVLIQVLALPLLTFLYLRQLSKKETSPVHGQDE